MRQDWWNKLEILSVKNNRAGSIDFLKTINDIANIKSRKVR